MSNVINNAKLFDNNLTKVRPVLSAKVVTIVLDYFLKMEKNLKEMKIVFVELELEATL